MATTLEAALTAYKNSFDAESVRLTLDLTPAEHKRLKEFSKAHQVTMSAMMRLILSTTLDEAERKQSEAQQATA